MVVAAGKWSCQTCACWVPKYRVRALRPHAARCIGLSESVDLPVACSVHLEKSHLSQQTDPLTNERHYQPSPNGSNRGVALSVRRARVRDGPKFELKLVLGIGPC